MIAVNDNFGISELVARLERIEECIYFQKGALQLTKIQIVSFDTTFGVIPPWCELIARGIEPFPRVLLDAACFVVDVGIVREQ